MSLLLYSKGLTAREGVDTIAEAKRGRLLCCRLMQTKFAFGGSPPPSKLGVSRGGSYELVRRRFTGIGGVFHGASEGKGVGQSY